MVSSSWPSPAQPAAPKRSSSASTSDRGTSKLGRMRRRSGVKPRHPTPGAKNYSAPPTADWEAAFSAPMRAIVPPELGGLRLDQALARLFPQYSRNRLQVWLESGHIRIENQEEKAKSGSHVAGGERIVLEPPAVPRAAAQQAQRMPLKVVYEDAELIVIDKPAGLVVHPAAGQPDRTLMNRLLAHAPALSGLPRAGMMRHVCKSPPALLAVPETHA